MSDIQLLDAVVKINYRKNKVFTTSRIIAEVFNKRHADVIRAIENPDIPADFRERNFALSFYHGTNNNKGKKYPEYHLTKKGFDVITLGFTGKNAMLHRIAYVEKFDEMEQALKDRNELRIEYRPLTDALQEKYGNKPWVYAREADMLNVIVTSCTAQQLKSTRKGKTTRELLNSREMENLKNLQKHDTTLLVIGFGFEQRKESLQRIFNYQLVGLDHQGV